MATNSEFEGEYKIIRYIVIIILSVIILRYLFRLLKPLAVMSFLNRFGRGANVELKADLFQSLEQLRKEVNSRGKLRILEIGAGAGANFKFFPNNSQVIALEPNKSCVSYLQENVKKYEDVELVEIIHGKIEELDTAVEDASVDAVVCTFVLCSVEDVDGAMRQILRVLKPSGRFYFMEHVKDFHHNSWTHIAQRLVYPFLLAVADCNCLRETNTHIDKAGFSHTTYKQVIGSKTMPFVVRPTLPGYATK